MGGGKGISDWIGISFDPFGTIFGDSLGFDVDPIGNMIGTSFANITGLATGEKTLGDVRNNFFGRNWIGDVANPLIGGESRQDIQQRETFRMADEQAMFGYHKPANEDLWKPFRSHAKTPHAEIPTSLLTDTSDENEAL